MTVLLLGGTQEARTLAGQLVTGGVPIVTSLAGAVSPRTLPPGDVRIGGFGGVAGLLDYLSDHNVSQVVDATHPFAAQITAHAAVACDQLAIPLLRLLRPSWRHHPESARWWWVNDLPAARQAAEDLGRRVFLSIGRQSAADFIAWNDRYVLVRVIEPPDVAVPETWEVLAARGPFDRAAERALLRDRRIDVLVTKDSGGAQTVAKLDAAADLGVPVVIVARPPAEPDTPVVETVEAALTWISGARGA